MKHISREPIRIADFIEHDTPDAGAFVIFSGEARVVNQDIKVEHLEYEAHLQLADSTIAAILESAENKFKLRYAQCVHRIGRLSIGESAVIVVTAAPHREEAYAANRYIIDRIKSEAPIWKKEFFQDGSSQWGR